LFGAPRFLAFAPGGALVGIRETFSFSALERGFLHKKALALVTAP